MKEKILVVDDEKDIRTLLKACLANEGYEVVLAKNGQEAMDILDDSFLMVLLDVMMPVKDGIATCLEIRKISKVPIIFLTAKSQDKDMVRGLTAGADDYITKPFTPSLLIAKVKAIIRRFTVFSESENDGRLYVKDLIIDEKAHQVFCGGIEINLTKIEFEILLLLVNNQGQVFSIETIYQKVWKEEYLDVSANTVMVHIKKLRTKLSKANDVYDYIKTVWGVGYKVEK